MNKGSLWLASVLIIALLSASSLFFLYLLSQCANGQYFETKTVYPEKPIIIPVDPNYLNNKLGVTPKDFPYKRVDLDAVIETRLVNSLSLYQPQGHIATFETGARQYVSLFKESQESLIAVVSWFLDNAEGVKIAQVVSEKLRYLGHVTYVSEQSINPYNISYRTVGGADYYELNVQITSPSQVLGTLYHVYGWTRQEGYYLGVLVYSVTAAGYFWINYGVEAWADQDVSYSTRPVWSEVQFSHNVVANHGPSASIRADGVARGDFIIFWIYMHLWASVGVDCYAQGPHYGGGWTWTELKS